MHRKNIMFVICILYISLLLSGCADATNQSSQSEQDNSQTENQNYSSKAPSAQDMIVGKWELMSITDNSLNLKSGEAEQMEFTKDGRVIIVVKTRKYSSTGALQTIQASAKYDFLNDGRVRFSGDAPDEISKVTFSGNDMEVTEANGAVSIFQKL